MSKRLRNILLLSLFALGVAALVLWRDNLKNLLFFYSDSIPLQKIVKEAQPGEAGGGKNGREPGAEPGFQTGSIPESAQEASKLPPSPPLPEVAPESTQEERKEAFELNQSVDQIVRKDEPLALEGKKTTIDDILNQLRGNRDLKELFPSIQESQIGGYIRKPIFAAKSKASAPSAYYGVRVVRPGENLWKIHYRIIEEYLARRHVILPPRADEPYPDGRSSGVARLLKFIENVVYVYNLDKDQLEKNRNVIYPDSVLVFFKISDVFKVLDQLNAKDIQWVRFVHNQLRIEGPKENRELLDSHAMVDEKPGG